ncbi:secreted RxLR effector protein 161-like [Aristolochia californica]|uniref:secreted RxLR effector protein 161-like n=1 Tax=Aristolochia californica TaxID=171875 RepID=UPI0035DD8252
MKDCSPSVAPIVKGDMFNLNQCPNNDFEREQMKDIPYASAVGSLMYVQVCTRPDIAFVVGMLGRYQSNPGLDHWRAEKKVMRYLQGTKDYMLMYRRADTLEVIGYSDSDFVGCIDSRKSTLGYIFLMASGAISWRNVKQTLTATSTMEANFESNGPTFFMENVVLFRKTTFPHPWRFKTNVLPSAVTEADKLDGSLTYK